MFTLDEGALQIIARTVIVYVAVLGGLRLAGKRELGQMTAFDLVVVLLVSNAVQNAMVGDDTSVTGGIIAAAVLIGGNEAVSRLSEHVPWLRRAVTGTPTLLISDGAFVEQNLAREKLDKEQVLMALREHGIEQESDAKIAVLEVDGSISVVPKDSETLRTRRHQRFRKL